MEPIIRPVLANITTLAQHQIHVEEHPEEYCPDHCPYCGISGLRLFCCYYRVPDRENSSSESMNPVKILRFTCPDKECGRTSSTLPACLPPRRWYLWEVQQQTLSQLLDGRSARQVSRCLTPSRRTVARWWQWLNRQYQTFSHHILNHLYEELGRYNRSAADFWSALFARYSLREGMVINLCAGVRVP
jgi:hypothetical protein